MYYVSKYFRHIGLCLLSSIDRDIDDYINDDGVDDDEEVEEEEEEDDDDDDATNADKRMTE